MNQEMKNVFSFFLFLSFFFFFFFKNKRIYIDRDFIVVTFSSNQICSPSDDVAISKSETFELLLLNDSLQR